MNRKHQRAEMALHRERVNDSLHELLAGTEDLLRSTASYTGSEIEAARARLKQQLADARESAGDWEGVARERARRARAYADEYVHEHAWKSVGVATLVAAAVAALSLVLPVWAAAVITAVVLFAAAGIAALVSKKQVEQVPPPAAKSVDSVKTDIAELKGARHGSRA